MRVALIGYEANIKNRVGSNQYAFELIKALYELDQLNEYDVYLPSAPLPDLPKGRENWRYKVVGPGRLWNIFGLPLALFGQKPRPDVVFNPGHYSPLFFPSPLVVSIMDLGYLHYPEQFTKPILMKLKLWTAISIKRSSAILAISKSTRNDIIKNYTRPTKCRSVIRQCRVDSEKIYVTYLGYDRKKFRVQSGEGRVDEVKKKYGIKGDYLLFLSTLKPNKNIEGLLEAFALLVGSRELGGMNHSELRTPNSKLRTKLVIAGRKGWLFEPIFEKMKTLGLADKVIFTDFVDEESVPALMAGASVFILPSFWEGFGIPVLEAMACGTPVVVSGAGSLPEIVGDAGIIVNPHRPEEIAEGIKKAIENRKKLSENGLRKVENFSWGKCAKETLAVLEKVTARQ